jgi:hypothetical protein
MSGVVLFSLPSTEKKIEYEWREKKTQNPHGAQVAKKETRKKKRPGKRNAMAQNHQTTIHTPPP